MALAAPHSRPVTARTVMLVATALVLGTLSLRALDPQRVAWIRSYIVIFGSLLVQALPFVTLGSLAAAFVEVFVPIGTLERVARRLAQRGLMPSAAVTFMLAAPVVNPVVIASTFVAYRARPSTWTMVGGRFALGMLVAIAVGWVIGNRSVDELLKPNPEDVHERHLRVERPEARWRRFFSHLGNDFLFMGRYLILGVTIAAAIQTFLPASALTSVSGVPIVSIVVMMVLAAALSLCSESDAFVAASFVQFGPAAQLAFLVSGPMVDTKLLALYAGTFRRGFVRAVVAVVFVTTLISTLWLGVITG